MRYNPPLHLSAGEIVFMDIVASFKVALKDAHYHRFSFSLDENSDVLVDSETIVDGVFPILGEKMETVNYALGNLRFKPQGEEGLIEEGVDDEKNVVLGHFSLINKNHHENNVDLMALAFSNIGNVVLSDTVENLRLFVDGKSIPLETVFDGENVFFSFDVDVFELMPDVPYFFTIVGDVDFENIDETKILHFTIREVEDVVAVEKPSGFAVRTFTGVKNDPVVATSIDCIPDVSLAEGVCGMLYPVVFVEKKFYFLELLRSFF